MLFSLSTHRTLCSVIWGTRKALKSGNNRVVSGVKAKQLINFQRGAWSSVFAFVVLVTQGIKVLLWKLIVMYLFGVLFNCNGRRRHLFQRRKKCSKKKNTARKWRDYCTWDLVGEWTVFRFVYWPAKSQVPFLGFRHGEGQFEEDIIEKKYLLLDRRIYHRQKLYVLSL
ncbi:hypothetical protein CEXT_695231 [Caerostris extrusa]|uniref:Uncharacterized protein n=1 Tax=Caerostris extrusa TaxID=172846 RepID=A0AAV4S7T0_CAEEX|nr:hypothetical protein CEXT_695231 [Caerostris extrusa]